MLNKEVKHTDIREMHSAAEWARLAEEVETTQRPMVLTRDGKDIVELRPAKPGKAAGRKLRKGQPTSADDPLWRIIGIGADPTDPVTDVSLNTDKYLAEAYADKHL